MRKLKKTTLLASKSLLKYPYKPFFACAGRAPPGSGHLCGQKRQKPRGFMRERPQNSRTLVFLNGPTTNSNGDQGLPRQSGETCHQYSRAQTTLLDVRTTNRWRNSMNVFLRNPMANVPPVSPRSRKVTDTIGLSLIRRGRLWHTPPLSQSWIVTKGSGK